MRPRIAYVINSVEGGGAALPVPAITRVMRDWGAEVRVLALTRRDGRALDAMTAAGLDVKVRDGGLTDHLAALRWLDAEVRTLAPALIWTSLSRATLLGQILGTFRGIPVISWQHAAYLKPWNRRLMRLMSGRARLWVADSQSVAALTARRLRVPPDRLMTWPIFAADPVAPAAVPWQPGEVLRLGSLGRLHPVKGYDVLIAALAQLRAGGFVPPAPFEIAIAGDGDQGPMLRAAAEAAGVTNITWPGYVTAPKAFLAGLHGYLQPSRAEGFCIAAHEAMQAGLPVIVSAVGELAHTVQDGLTGLVVPPDDPAALAAALARLLREPDKMHTLGAAARARVLDTFSAARFTAAGRAILDRIAPEIV
ncbi:MAG: glycosyltransferase family 4 protein [Rhodobacteraceae bacterium]|nr:glycosyltransferase family 4 protein [Paracoccaceae bacterium]